jgi:hypothetical protein
MSKAKKRLERILLGQSDQNLDFEDLCNVLLDLGFTMRINGSHHIFVMEGVEEILNLQPLGHQAKAYQVKQVRNLITKYQLGRFDE